MEANCHHNEHMIAFDSQVGYICSIHVDLKGIEKHLCASIDINLLSVCVKKNWKIESGRV